MDFPSSDFWDWTLPTYGREGVSPACLRLQDRHDVDVNIVLFAVWAALRGVELADADVATAVREVRDWHVRVVKPLREIRTRLKDDPHGAPRALADSFREEIKRLELGAERMEHVILGAGLPKGPAENADPSERCEIAERSVRRYLQMLDSQLDAEDLAAIRTIVAAGIGSETTSA